MVTLFKGFSFLIFLTIYFLFNFSNTISKCLSFLFVFIYFSVLVYRQEKCQRSNCSLLHSNCDYRSSYTVSKLTKEKTNKKTQTSTMKTRRKTTDSLGIEYGIKSIFAIYIHQHEMSLDRLVKSIVYKSRVCIVKKVCQTMPSVGVIWKRC